VTSELLQSSRRRRDGLRLLLLAVCLGLVYAAIPLQNDRWWMGLVVGAIVLVAIVPFTVRRVAAIETSSEPVFAALKAALVVVAMVIFAFSSVYLALDRGGGEFEGLETKIDAVYFTVSTLSTVGYGDIHAVGQRARLAVTVQILVDLSVIALSVRAFVAAARSRRGVAGHT
jgi:voltage-gated potassium channel